jgi:hypothetical protein
MSLADLHGSVLLRDNFRCVRCGVLLLSAEGRSVHHLLNRSQGGKDAASNLILLCGSGTTGCHGWVTEHPRQARDEGGWARRSRGPLLPDEIPVLYAQEGGRQGWFTLGDDFSLTAWEAA